MHKDVTGKELVIGDTVAFVHGGYPKVHIGKILAFTAKKVRIEIRQHTTLKNAADIVKVD